MEAIDQLRARLGLDRPIPVQYVEFMAGVLTGDWGISMVSGRPVIQEILKVLPATLELTLVSLVLGAVIGIPLGVWSAVKRNRLPDYVTRLASLLPLLPGLRVGRAAAAGVRAPPDLVPGDKSRPRHHLRPPGAH